MNPTRRNKMLGLAIGERVAHVAEVASSGGPGRASVQRVAEFWYQNGVDLSHPEALGRALADFLREQGFSTRMAVVGIPGKWVLTKRVEAPPAEPQLVAETLRLQAEGEFAGDGGGEFAYDYAGRASSTQATPVLLMAVAKRQLDAVTAVATAAGVRAVAVVPYAATLAAATAKLSKNPRVLLFGPGGAEFVAQNNGFPHVMRYLGPATSPPAFLAGELRRASAGSTFGGGGSAAGQSPGGAGSNGAAAAGGELHVWNDARLEPAALRTLGESVGSVLKLGEAHTLGVTGGAGAAQAPAGYAAAVSLAMAGIEGNGSLPVNFLHSRLAAVKPVRVRRKTLVIAASAALVLGAGVWGYADISSRQAELDGLKRELKDADAPAKVARSTVARVEFAQAWSGESPQFLACMNDVTASLPADGQTYLTNFTLNDRLKGTFSGKASTPDEVFRLVDRLKETGRFADVSPQFDAAAKPAAKKGAGQPAQPGQPQPPQPPPAQPGPPGQPPPGMPPGMPPGAMPAGAQAMVITEAMMNEPSALTLVEGSPNPVVQVKSGQAVAVAAAPPGAQPAPPRAGRPARAPRGEGGPPTPGGAPGGPGGAPPPGGEVTFTMSFNYVTNK